MKFCKDCNYYSAPVYKKERVLIFFPIKLLASEAMCLETRFVRPERRDAVSGEVTHKKEVIYIPCSSARSHNGHCGEDAKNFKEKEATQ